MEQAVEVVVSLFLRRRLLCFAVHSASVTIFLGCLGVAERSGTIRTVASNMSLSFHCILFSAMYCVSLGFLNCEYIMGWWGIPTVVAGDGLHG